MRGPSQQALQFRARRAQLHQCGPHAVTGNAQLVGPWFNSLDGANYLRQNTRGAFQIWAKRNGVVPVRRAGLVLYAKADIDRVLGLLGRKLSA
jgi:hypothetical protein